MFLYGAVKFYRVLFVHFKYLVRILDPLAHVLKIYCQSLFFSKQKERRYYQIAHIPTNF
jgi:hypothetical protein